MLLHRLREEFFPRPDAFDLQRGVHTAGLKSLMLERLTRRDCVHYQPVSEQWFQEAIEGVPRWTFIDMGCGRGRALILAHEAGFRKLIGVEYSHSLCRTARRNLRKLGIEAQIHCQDAATFDFPEEPCVVFFYNPFGVEIMSKVIGQLGTSPRALVYVEPKHAELFHRFKLMKSLSRAQVYLTA